MGGLRRAVWTLFPPSEIRVMHRELRRFLKRHRAMVDALPDAFVLDLYLLPRNPEFAMAVIRRGMAPPHLMFTLLWGAAVTALERDPDQAALGTFALACVDELVARQDVSATEADRLRHRVHDDYRTRAPA